MLLAGLGYVIVEAVGAAAWTDPPYNYLYDQIPDLGNPTCGPFQGRVVCSPLYGLMNDMFFVYGILFGGAGILLSRLLIGSRRAQQAAEKLASGSAWREHGYVFTTRVGTPERGDNVLSRGLKPLMVRAGLPPHNFQTLRRSNATFLVLLGVSPRVAMMAWMGHSDVATTMRFYQQAPDELQEKAARLMGELLLGEAPQRSQDGLENGG
jgi:hypothetical protein